MDTTTKHNPMPKKDKPTRLPKQSGGQVWKKVRFPLPKKSEYTHSTKRGKKGYRREKIKEEIEQLIEDGLE
ncbi:MAG: hypothetical protein QMD71_08290 [bacterium]|nr:hypothetical protein [bacterium]